MGSRIVRPHIVSDDKGRPRLKLKRGRGAHHSAEGPHVHYFSSGGMRVDDRGRPVASRLITNFRPIAWDLGEDESDAGSAGPPDVGLALEITRRSAGFNKLLEETQRAGWVIELGTLGFPAGCRPGPHTVSLDTSRRGAFTSGMVHDIALAHVLAAPLPITDPDDPSFVRETSLALLRRDGEASLRQAIVRDEILAAGGVDIGGPGLRGLQHEAYRMYGRDDVPLAKVVDAIAFSIDGQAGRGFDRSSGPRIGRTLETAFAKPSTLVASGLSAETLDVLEAVRAFPALTAHVVARAFGVDLAPRPMAIENPLVSVLCALLPDGPFSWVELREPARGASQLASRLLLVPRYETSHFDLTTWFGRGEPYHLDLRDKPVATVAYPFDKRSLYVTYDVTDQRTLRGFAVHGR